jgi:hypothetical protein
LMRIQNFPLHGGRLADGRRKGRLRQSL